jgi:hypothetical protein
MRDTGTTRPRACLLLVCLFAFACNRARESDSAAPDGPNLGAPSAPASHGPESPDASLAAVRPLAAGAPLAPGAAPLDGAAPPPAAPEDAAGPVPPAPDAAGPAVPDALYLSLLQQGLLKLDADGRAQRVFERPTVYALARDGGRVLVATSDGVRIVEGDEVRELPAEPTLVHVLALGPGVAGEVWAVTRNSLCHYDGTAWSVTPMSDVSPAVERLVDVAVDGAGTPWLLASDRVFRRGDAGWVEAPVAGLTSPYFVAFARHPEGDVAVVSLRGLYRRTGEAWAQVDLGFVESGGGRRFSLGAAAWGAAGGLATAHRALLITAPAGGLPHRVELSDGLPVSRVARLAVDGQGRVWAGTDAGLAAFSGDGRRLGFWPPGTWPGMPATIDALVVTGNGPALPPEPGDLRGTVRGRVALDGEPAADAMVELCTKVEQPRYAGTPCGFAEWYASARTDAAGAFQLADVPPGTYELAVFVRGGWRRAAGDRCCGAVRPDQPLDLGTLRLGEPLR